METKIVKGGFKVGKSYRHTNGEVLRICGYANTHIYGECLVAEDEKGNLQPVGSEEGNTVNYEEI